MHTRTKPHPPAGSRWHALSTCHAVSRPLLTHRLFAVRAVRARVHAFTGTARLLYRTTLKTQNTTGVSTQRAPNPSSVAAHCARYLLPVHASLSTFLWAQHVPPCSTVRVFRKAVWCGRLNAVRPCVPCFAINSYGLCQHPSNHGDTLILNINPKKVRAKGRARVRNALAGHAARLS